jgi:hypothetical protein
MFAVCMLVPSSVFTMLQMHFKTFGIWEANCVPAPLMARNGGGWGTQLTEMNLT